MESNRKRQPAKKKPATRQEQGLRFRDRLAADIEQRYDKLLAMLDDAMVAVKKVSMRCEHCGRMTFVEVPNERAALAVAQYFTENGFGRPGVTDQSDQERIRFIRVTVDPTDGVDEEERKVAAAIRADEEALKREREEAHS